MEAHNCRIPSQAASVVEGSRGISYSAHGGRCGADCGRWGPRGTLSWPRRAIQNRCTVEDYNLAPLNPTGWQCSCKTLWLWSWSFVKRTLRTTHIQVSNIQTASLHIIVLYFSSVHNFDPFGKPTSGTTNKVWGTHKHYGATCKCASSLFLSLGMIQQWLTQFNGISQRSYAGKSAQRSVPPTSWQASCGVNCVEFLSHFWVPNALRGFKTSFCNNILLLCFFGRLQGIWKASFKQPPNIRKSVSFFSQAAWECPKRSSLWDQPPASPAVALGKRPVSTRQSKRI